MAVLIAFYSRSVLACGADRPLLDNNAASILVPNEILLDVTNKISSDETHLVTYLAAIEQER